MAGEQTKVEYVTGSDGVKYKIHLTPVNHSADTLNSLSRWSKKKWTAVLSIILAIILLAVAYSYIFLKAKIPETSIAPTQLTAIASSLPYPIYYPVNLPNGYSFSPDSLSIVDNVLFFSLTNGKQTLLFSEQSSPDTEPVFNFLEIEKSNNIIGAITVGKSDGAIKLPAAVLQTKETLVNITASSPIPIKDLRLLIEMLGTVPSSQN